VFLVDNGLKKWRKLDAKELEARKASQVAHGPSEAARVLLANLTTESIIVNLQSNSKEKVIEELVDHAIKSSDQHIDKIQTLQVLGERENMSSTGIGNGIAIPHCRLMALEKPVLVFGTHNTGIEFAGVDNEPCKIFLLMLTCTRDPGEHLRLLSAASHILSDEQTRNKEVNAESPKEFIGILEAIAKL
jgi:nitrogen PTS system EIIA component